MSTPDELDPLRYHGDVAAVPGLLDFAVNVRGEAPPPWLTDRLAGALARLGRYPSTADDSAAVAEAADAATETARHREWMADRLAALPGVQLHQPAAGPYLLLRVPDGERVRAALSRNGIAVRRADTFPGLTPDHLRVAVRPPAVATALLDALRSVLEPVFDPAVVPA